MAVQHPKILSAVALTGLLLSPADLFAQHGGYRGAYGRPGGAVAGNHSASARPGMGNFWSHSGNGMPGNSNSYSAYSPYHAGSYSPNAWQGGQSSPYSMGHSSWGGSPGMGHSNQSWWNHSPGNYNSSISFAQSQSGSSMNPNSTTPNSFSKRTVLDESARRTTAAGATTGSVGPTNFALDRSQSQSWTRTTPLGTFTGTSTNTNVTNQTFTPSAAFATTGMGMTSPGSPYGRGANSYSPFGSYGSYGSYGSAGRASANPYAGASYNMPFMANTGYGASYGGGSPYAGRPAFSYGSPYGNVSYASPASAGGFGAAPFPGAYAGMPGVP